MMKLLSRLCFLVLAIASLSRGQDEPTDAPEPTTKDFMDSTPAPRSDNEPKDDDDNSTATSPSPQSDTTGNTMDPLPQGVTTQETPGDDQKDNNATVNPTTKEGSTAAKTTAPTSVPKSGKGGESVDVTTTVSTATNRTSSKPGTVTNAKDHSSWGYVVLVMIILVIIALCVILYILRRVSRTYSFDLQRPVPVNHLDEPIGTFEPVYLDDLDQPAPKDEVTTEEIPPAPAANGTTVQSEENVSTGENGTTPNQVSPASEDQPDYKRDSLLQKFAYLYEDEQQNENNNNPSVCSSDPFVEINLDDPARCDQLLTSPEAPSSVLPFSPFSFSTSSSTSS